MNVNLFIAKLEQNTNMVCSICLLFLAFIHTAFDVR